MKKTPLGVARVVVFCITWWLVAGEAMQVAQQAKQAYQQTGQAHLQTMEAFKKAFQAYKPAEQAYQQTEQAYIQARQAYKQAEQASIMADAHWRTQGSWGIGAGLLVDVLLLIGALAWSKLTAKP